MHGIVPHALSGAAVEELVQKARAAHGSDDGAASGPITSGGQSLEGSGEAQVDEASHGGRFQTELVDSMHEVGT